MYVCIFVLFRRTEITRWELLEGFDLCSAYRLTRYTDMTIDLSGGVVVITDLSDCSGYNYHSTSTRVES